MNNTIQNIIEMDKAARSRIGKAEAQAKKIAEDTEKKLSNLKKTEQARSEAQISKDIAEIKKRTNIPIIGIYKTEASREIPYITPDFEHAKAIADLGVEIIALDATLRPRPNGVDIAELIQRIKNELGVLVMADIATFEEGVAAEKAGADIGATTLSGYTTYSQMTDGPDYELIKRLKAEIKTPIIAEGRFTSPQDLKKGIEYGAHAVVIGKVITNVMFSTNKFITEAGLK